MLEGADRWMGDPAREAEFLLGQEKWNSREPTVIEDASLLVLVTPKGGRRPETSDIRITDESGADRELSVGRVVNGRLEVQRIHLEHAGDGSRSFATLEFEAAGPPALVCLPLPTS